AVAHHGALHVRAPARGRPPPRRHRPAREGGRVMRGARPDRIAGARRSEPPVALAAFFAALAGAAVYLQALAAEFVWDDHVLAATAHPLRAPGDLPRLLTSHAFAGAGGLMGGGSVVEYWRPVWTLTIALDQRLWGMHASG